MELYLEGLGQQKEVQTKGVIELANWANDQSSWQEPPISIEPTQSYGNGCSPSRCKGI